MLSREAASCTKVSSTSIVCIHMACHMAYGMAMYPASMEESTTVIWAFIHAILALAALEDLKLESVDISSACLNGELKEDVHMQQPEGFKEKTPQWVWRLRKALYGLKQAGRCWHEKLHEVRSSLDFCVWSVSTLLGSICATGCVSSFLSLSMTSPLLASPKRPFSMLRTTSACTSNCETLVPRPGF